VHPEREALAREVLHHRLEVGELLDECRPAVDHQIDVAERIGRRGVTGVLPQLPVGRDGPDAVLFEHRFTLP
jgi:hypothetical protein